MSKALLICNGQKPGKWLKKYLPKVDFVLAADAGADNALAAGIVPDAVIGDLDSVSPRTHRQLKEVPFLHVKRQDNTDLEKALDWLVEQKFDSCIIAGASGGRLDFTLGNVLSARSYSKKIDIVFCAEKWTLYVLTHSFTFSAKKGARCSLIPLTPCTQVTLKGLKYCVTKENWDTQHIGRSLSNQITAKQSQVCFAGGCMLLYVEK